MNDDLISRQAAIDALGRPQRPSRRKGEPMSDLISRQAAIDLIKNDAFWVQYAWGGRGHKPEMEMVDDLVESIIKQMKESVMSRLKQMPSAQPEQRWIPCSERLPENEDIYLATFDKSNLLDNETQVTDAYWINNQWQYGVLESYEHRMPKLVIEPIEELKVIAWMPMPEPYKGEE